MNTYLVKGADKSTGKDRNFTIKAIDQKHAEAAIARDGVLISETLIKSDDDKWEKIKPPAEETVSEMYLRKIHWWIRLWSILSIIGIIIILCMPGERPH